MTSGTPQAPFRVLGLSAGSTNGSAEIVLKSALRAAEETGAVVEHVRLNDLSLPAEDRDGDMTDLWWFWERLVECDGLVVAAPLFSRTVNARLKLLVDRLLGPNADAAIIEDLVALRRAGTEPAVPFRVDERVLKAAGRRVPRRGRCPDLAVAQPRPAAHAHRHPVDADRRRRPGPVRRRGIAKSR
jgi:hypothetical protein